MSLLLDWRVWVVITIAALGVFGAVQTGRLDHEKAAFALFRAETAKVAAEAQARNAQERAREAQNATEVLSDLQTRHAALGARYVKLRDGSGSGRMPDLASAAARLGSCGPKSLQPDPTARFLGTLESEITGILEAGDLEIAKYVELWALQQKNAAH